MLDNRASIHDAVFMMQREVARRLVAVPHTKEYGILAVFCQLFTTVELLFDVSPHVFFPRPEVTSSLVRLTVLEEPRYSIKNEDFFRTMVRSMFGKRRKTLRNSLAYVVDQPQTKIPGSFDLNRRPEDLSGRELVELSNALYDALRESPTV
jgi:16S rRNA (adenine1518-N6/adenine1519-N6)-dimethyltransferase